MTVLGMFAISMVICVFVFVIKKSFGVKLSSFSKLKKPKLENKTVYGGMSIVDNFIEFEQLDYNGNTTKDIYRFPLSNEWYEIGRNELGNEDIHISRKHFSYFVRQNGNEKRVFIVPLKDENPVCKLDRNLRVEELCTEPFCIDKNESFLKIGSSYFKVKLPPDCCVPIKAVKKVENGGGYETKIMMRK